MAILPPLTTNEKAAFEVLGSDSAVGFTAVMIAERTGLDWVQAERALRSLGSRKPPLANADHDDDGARWTAGLLA
jgi:hypothetical protein